MNRTMRGVDESESSTSAPTTAPTAPHGRSLPRSLTSKRAFRSRKTSVAFTARFGRATTAMASLTGATAEISGMARSGMPIPVTDFSAAPAATARTTTRISDPVTGSGPRRGYPSPDANAAVAA